MKKIFVTLMLIATLTASSLNAVSQTKSSSTVTIDQTIAFLLKENENAKNLISAHETRIKDLEAEVVVERENSESALKSYEAAKSEIANLKSANESLRKAVTLNEQTIALLQTDNAKKTEKAKKATKDKWKAYGITAITIAISYFLR